jgi:7-keto-8-aminopelargonate synthetase-like enzyme
VIADSVFSMDGDIIDLPKMLELCKQYNAWLMIDEAHSVGVLGETGTGIEEHFGLGM